VGRAKRDEAAKGPWAGTGIAFLVGLAAVALVSGRRGAPPSPAVPSPTAAAVTGERPPEVRTWLDEARRHLESDELNEAQSLLEKARDRSPQDPEVAFALGDVAYRGLQMEAAERHYRRASALDPRSAAALANLALVLLELGDAQGAGDAASRAIALDPRDPRLSALLGQSRLRLGQPAEAARLLEPALRSGAGGATNWAALGRARDLLGQTEPALQAFDEAVKEDPQLPLVHYWRAECLRKAGRDREAERERAEYRRCQERVERETQARLRARLRAAPTPAP